MFEKDAEEIMRQNGCRTHSGNFIQANKVCELIQKGAEFGYNKAKVEVEEKYKETICNLEMNLASVTERLEELEKANEWHKPSEKLPEECSLVLAYSFDDTEPALWKFVTSDQWEWLPKRIVFCSNDQIRLWKEIVLPKESE